MTGVKLYKDLIFSFSVEKGVEKRLFLFSLTLLLYRCVPKYPDIIQFSMREYLHSQCTTLLRSTVHQLHSQCSQCFLYTLKAPNGSLMIVAFVHYRQNISQNSDEKAVRSTRSMRCEGKHGGYVLSSIDSSHTQLNC